MSVVKARTLNGKEWDLVARDGIVQEDPTVMMTLMDMVFNREQ